MPGDRVRRRRHQSRSELGVQDPVGLWDPLGFASDGNGEKLRHQTELRHGMISMFATTGCIIPEITGKLPDCLS